MERLAKYCSEFLIHAADVEGLSQGIDEVRVSPTDRAGAVVAGVAHGHMQDLVRVLGDWSPIPCTYAGGANSLQDLERVRVGMKGVGLPWDGAGMVDGMFEWALPWPRQRSSRHCYALNTCHWQVKALSQGRVDLTIGR